VAVECDGDFGVGTAPAVCCSAVADVERWPEWASDLERVEVLSRDDEGRPARVRMVADLFGKEFDATVDFHYDRAPGELRFTLVEARKLASLEGAFGFQPQSSGTRVTYRFGLVLVKPKAPRIERMVSRKVDTYLSRDLRRHIERNFARR
jgi:ribosome-associated toxin RatA of RatAB toxin-antitoxin module